MDLHPYDTTCHDIMARMRNYSLKSNTSLTFDFKVSSIKTPKSLIALRLLSLTCFLFFG
jgi:hypothetical protein